MDRFADGADGLREILDRVMARHIAGLEMHFGDAAVVARDEAQQNFGEEAPLLQPKPAHDAEIDRDQPAGIVEKQIAGMHVGMEEAVAQRVAQETLDHLAAEVGQVDLRLRQARMVVQRDAVDPLHRQHVVGGAVPIDGRHAEIRIVTGVLRHLGQRGRLQPQVHLHRDRARHRIDDLDQPQPPRFGRMALGIVRDKEEIGEIAAEARGDIGPEHLDGDRLAHAVMFDLAAMHLCDRGGGDRRPEADKRLCHRAFQRLRDHGLGLGLRKRRQPVLQAFQIARHRDADDVGPGRQKLSELEIGRSEPGQRARQPRAGFGAGPLDQPRQPQRELPGRRHQTRIDDAEHAFAREHVSGADQPRDVGRRRNHKRQPECNATMPPDRLSHFTREKPASRIISANALGLGNFRIDSTRYW